MYALAKKNGKKEVEIKQIKIIVNEIEIKTRFKLKLIKDVRYLKHRFAILSVG